MRKNALYDAYADFFYGRKFVSAEKRWRERAVGRKAAGARSQSLLLLISFEEFIIFCRWR